MGKLPAYKCGIAPPFFLAFSGRMDATDRPPATRKTTPTPPKADEENGRDGTTKSGAPMGAPLIASRKSQGQTCRRLQLRGCLLSVYFFSRLSEGLRFSAGREAWGVKLFFMV